MGRGWGSALVVGSGVADAVSGWRLGRGKRIGTAGSAVNAERVFSAGMPAGRLGPGEPGTGGANPPPGKNRHQARGPANRWFPGPLHAEDGPRVFQGFAQRLDIVVVVVDVKAGARSGG